VHGARRLSGLSGSSGLFGLSGSFLSTKKPDKPDRPNNGLLTLTGCPIVSGDTADHNRLTSFPASEHCSLVMGGF
jgi:hypothetical protein